MLDIRLPGRSGTEICKELKLTSSIPILLFSTSADEEKIVKECKADGFISKPFDMNELIGAVGLHAYWGVAFYPHLPEKKEVVKVIKELRVADLIGINKFIIPKN